jgi:hypothetical protein
LHPAASRLSRLVLFPGLFPNTASTTLAQNDALTRKPLQDFFCLSRIYHATCFPFFLLFFFSCYFLTHEWNDGWWVGLLGKVGARRLWFGFGSGRHDIGECSYVVDG